MPKPIPNSVVPVSVTVAVDDQGDVNITCTPNPIPVNGFNSLIVFNLDTRGYRFHTVNAIQLDEPDDEFPYASWTVTPTLATFYDACSSEATFNYTVRLINTITDVEYSVDPEIKNGDQG